MEHSKILTKPLYVLIIIILVAVLLIGIYLVISGTATPKGASGTVTPLVAPETAVHVVASGDTISVYYTGTLTNGTVFDSNVEGQPLNFTVGSGQLIKGFDQGVIGMKLNETKTITIPANEAYGEVNPTLIIKVPLEKFGNQSIQPGTAVSEISSGQSIQGIVTAVNETTATVDFNPPLAGKTLIFNIRVVQIQKK